MRAFVLSCACWVLAASLAGQEDPGDGAYRLGPRDKVLIRVDELPSLNGEQVVDEDGTLVLPVVGTVQVRGLTEDELAARLRSRLEREGLRKATVSATVIASRSRPISILGAVGRPGNHFIPGGATLTEALSVAGWLAPDHGPSILVRRRAANGLSDQLEISVRDLLDRGDPAVDIPIQAGDRIHVPVARELTVHFLGQVREAGSLTFPAHRRVTLLTAIARAGGLLETASKKLRIRRQGANGETTELVVDYRDVLNGREPDPELVDGDLVLVKESFF